MADEAIQTEFGLRQPDLEISPVHQLHKHTDTFETKTISLFSCVLNFSFVVIHWDSIIQGSISQGRSGRIDLPVSIFIVIYCDTRIALHD